MHVSRGQKACQQPCHRRCRCRRLPAAALARAAALPLAPQPILPGTAAARTKRGCCCCTSHWKAPGGSGGGLIQVSGFCKARMLPKTRVGITACSRCYSRTLAINCSGWEQRMRVMSRLARPAMLLVYVAQSTLCTVQGTSGGGWARPTRSASDLLAHAGQQRRCSLLCAHAQNDEYGCWPLQEDIVPSTHVVVNVGCVHVARFKPHAGQVLGVVAPAPPRVSRQRAAVLGRQLRRKQPAGFSTTKFEAGAKRKRTDGLSAAVLWRARCPSSPPRDAPQSRAPAVLRCLLHDGLHPWRRHVVNLARGQR